MDYPKETDNRSTDAGKKWINTVIFLFLAAHIFLIWNFDFLPTQDGPIHVTNAMMLRNYFSDSMLQDLFTIDVVPLPNWIFQLFVIIFSSFVSPLMAEKLFFSLYCGCFTISFIYLLKAVYKTEHVIGLYSFVLLFNSLLITGFYNFSIGLAASFFVIGFWWKHRKSLDWRSSLILNSLLIFVYFCHLFPLGFCLFVIVFYVMVHGLLTRQYRDIFSAFLRLLPSFVLPFWYFFIFQGKDPTNLQMSLLANDYSRLFFTFQFSASQDILIYLFSVIFAVILGYFLYLRIKTCRSVVTLEPSGVHRYFVESDLLAAGAIILIILAFLVHGKIFGGTFLNVRLLLCGVSLLLPVVAVPMTALWNRIILSSLVVLISLNWMLAYSFFERKNIKIADFLSAARFVESGKTILPFVKKNVFRQDGKRSPYVLYHGIHHYYLKKGALSLHNYQAELAHFPLNFKKTANPNVIFGSSKDLGKYLRGDKVEAPNFNLYPYPIDYVLFWKFPKTHPYFTIASNHFTEVYRDTPEGRLILMKANESQ